MFSLCLLFSSNFELWLEEYRYLQLSTLMTELILSIMNFHFFIWQRMMIHLVFFIFVLFLSMVCLSVQLCCSFMVFLKDYWPWILLCFLIIFLEMVQMKLFTFTEDSSSPKNCNLEHYLLVKMIYAKVWKEDLCYFFVPKYKNQFCLFCKHLFLFYSGLTTQWHPQNLFPSLEVPYWQH